MKHRSVLILCILLLAVMMSCVLPGAQTPTITSIAVPPTENAPTDTPSPANLPTDTPQAADPNPPTPAEGQDNNTGIVRVKLSAPAAADGQPFLVTLVVNNRTRQPITGARAVLSVPGGLEVVEMLDGGEIENGELVWHLPDLPANNGRAEVHAVMQFRLSITNVMFENIRLEAPGLDPALVEISGLRFVFPDEVAVISAVQGAGDRSPYEGETLAVEGSVTGVFPGLGGFFLFDPNQIEEGASRGLFVRIADPESVVMVGQSARVRGVVREENGQTELVAGKPDDIQITGENAFMPGPYPFDPPQGSEEARRYFESFEGMPVALGPAVAVSPITRYGEFVAVAEKHGVSRIFQGEENGYAVMVDDGSSRQYGDAATLPYLVRTGDKIGGVTGLLAFTYGRFKIEPAMAFGISSSELVLPQIAPAGAVETSVMTWNVENLFDTAPPNPSDPPLPSPETYALSLRKVAATIAAAGAPDVVALQEVENLGVLEAIAAEEALSAFAYQAVLEEGQDQRGIDVGYLVRSDRVEVVTVRQYAENQGVYTRPPLLLTVRPKSGGAAISLINNHFKSMSGGAEASEPQRILQAQGNLSIVEELREADPNPAVAVLGDLNAYYQSAPIDILRGGGLTHVLEKLLPADRYTYNYEGESQVLDHVLVTDVLWQRIARVEILHINSDFPPPLPDDASPVGKSDHDPVIVIFSP